MSRTRRVLIAAGRTLAVFAAIAVIFGFGFGIMWASDAATGKLYAGFGVMFGLLALCLFGLNYWGLDDEPKDAPHE